ncbi:similar to TRICHOME BIREFRINGENCE-LIKE 34 [Actinidia rufa]|uniref:Similar to TRICHOME BIREFRINGENCE-LIKE 34 n=1 Tax=Actinidia rufa TaxID=165716 RepID=A0A7J0GF57_9ERIC|nr:similar to TRICHOME BIREFRINGENCE-LIKE 34 [Actinidia rufa]
MKSKNIRWSFQFLTALFVGFLFLKIFYAASENKNLVFDQKPRNSTGENKNLVYDQKPRNSTYDLFQSCNLFMGKWVYDNESYPHYRDRECSFMDDGMACEKFGRKDLNYQHWRWQPHDCDLPRFNGEAMLKMLRGKRLVFVGDSLNRNQWVSMVCLVEKHIPPEMKSLHFEYNGSLVTFKATEYNSSIDFYWAPLLVESNCDDPWSHRIQDRVVRVDAIEKHARHWADADILVFNSYIWWRWLKVKILWGSFESPDGNYEELEVLRVYEMVLKTWSDWLEAHVNRTKTKLFFVSMSPTHAWAEGWGNSGDQNCYNETEPISKEGYWGRDSDPNMLRIVEKAISRLKTRGLEVQMVNITQLSEYRKEAHSSIYRKHWDPLTEEQLAKPQSYADCIHWCLPGVPDVWNQFLYAYLSSYR